MDTWTTISGEKIPIKDMSDEHLTNAYHMLCRIWRNSFVDDQYLPLPIVHGDHAIDAVMEELDKRTDFHSYIAAEEPRYLPIYNEMSRRKLI